MNKHIKKTIKGEFENADLRIDIARVEDTDMMIIQDQQNSRRTTSFNFVDGEIKQLYNALKEWFEEDKE